MGLNGTSTLINGAVTQSKKRGRALVEELSRAYGTEEEGAQKAEGTKKANSHGKKK